MRRKDSGAAYAVARKQEIDSRCRTFLWGFDFDHLRWEAERCELIVYDEKGEPFSSLEYRQGTQTRNAFESLEEFLYKLSAKDYSVSAH